MQVHRSRMKRGFQSHMLEKNMHRVSGVDPGFEKGGGAVASGARSQDFFGQFRGLFKEFGATRGGRAPPPL